MKTEKEIKEIKLQFLEDVKKINYPKWVQEKNRQYMLNLSFSGVSHIANGLIDLAMKYAGGSVPSPFLSEIMEDSLIGAFTCADAINMQAIAIYTDFVYNIVPKDLWIKK